MGKKESVPNRRYTEEFKTEAVRLALSTGGNAAATAGDFAVDDDELGSAESRKDAGPVRERSSAGQASGLGVGSRECATAP
jgi:transposase-like protein